MKDLSEPILTDLQALTYQAAQYIYNIYFHPLSKFPGPAVAASSRLPLLHSYITGGIADRAQKLHAKYGDVVRVAPDELSYASAQAWKDIYGHRIGGKESFIKDSRFYADAEGKVHSIINSDDANHGRMRRIFSHAFSDKALKAQEPMFKTYVDMLIDRLHRDTKQDPDFKFDIVKMYNFTTFDIMGELTFGEPLHLLEGSDYIPWISAIFGGVRYQTVLQGFMYFPMLFSGLELLIPPSLKKLRKDHSKFSEDRVDRRLAKTTSKPDIWNLVLNQAEGKGLTKEEMYTNSSVFMVAGTETTATILSGLTYYLLKNPETMKKITAEIRGAFSSTSDIDMGRLAQLPYMNACLEEGLRMYPPVPIGLPRRTPATGATIDGTFVPPEVRYPASSPSLTILLTCRSRQLST